MASTFLRLSSGLVFQQRQKALPEGCSKQDLLKAMEGHILAYGELIGLYRRK